MPSTLKKKHIENADEISRILKVTNQLEPTDDGKFAIVSRRQLLDFQEVHRLDFPNWLTQDRRYRHSRGKYLLPLTGENPSATNVHTTVNTAVATRQEAQTMQNDATDDLDEVTASVVVDASGHAKIADEPQSMYIPTVDPTWVNWGHSQDIFNIIKSKRFFPVYFTGEAGIGKSKQIDQACAQQKRELIRVNITTETDEDDLIGGFRLIDGETVFKHGPVIEAMKRGAILLLDEVDLASNRIMCLQSVLEGGTFIIKKTGETIRPAEGFNVFATANTKGQGDTRGRFVGTGFLNEAFLDRFGMTLVQIWPDEIIEKKILTKYAKINNIEHKNLPEVIRALSQWAAESRVGFNDGSIDQVISTRRLIQIMGHISIFGDPRKAVTDQTARFDEQDQSTLVSLFDGCYDPKAYKKNDEGKIIGRVSEPRPEIDQNSVPF